MNYWLLKSEPETYSFSQLEKDGSTHWNGVRNYQARNFLKEAKKGDLAFFYHSGDDKAVVGLAEVIKEAYRDPEPGDKAEWFQIDIKPKAALKSKVTLAQLKADPAFKGLMLVTHSRLSVMPVSAPQFKAICKLGGVSA